MHGDLLSAPMGITASDKTSRFVSWEMKKSSKVMWRGDTTGMYARRGSSWRTSQRSRLVLRAHTFYFQAFFLTNTD